MESFRDRIARLSPQRLMLLAMELQSRNAELEAAAREPIAVVGMACRFPGEAATPAAFWQNLKQRRDCVGPISRPEARWQLAGTDASAVLKSAETAAGWHAQVESIEMFDPAFFHISPSEAAAMDPQQRILLEVCWEAIENAGIPADSLAASATGVFVGMSSNDYAMLAHSLAGDPSNKYIVTGAANSIAVGRISYLLGLQGPNMAVDTSCSSSATAIHLAIQSLRRGECGLAFAGGVHLALLPKTNETLSRFNLLAADGRCKTFSDSADGMGRGEGCGILLLKRLHDAQRDHDTIVGVLRGSACNQDGRTSGLTAPNGLAQGSVIRAALEDAGLSHADIAYVETHGTGTPLGDPIEVAALGRVFAEEGREGRKIAIGSVKSNIGHLEAAAGVAGVIKTLLALQEEEIPASLHCATLNRRVPWDDLPLAVARQAVAWPRGPQSRAAGVSSFGYSGTNVHIVIEEAPAQSAAASPNDPTPNSLKIVTASAKSLPALRQLCASYAKYLEANPGISIERLARSVNEGRSHFTHRFARVVSSVRDARDAFASLASNALDADWPISNQSPDSSAQSQRMQALQAISERYLAGADIDWKALPGWQPGPKLVLPNYPFDRQRYWLDLPDQPAARTPVSPSELHPETHVDDVIASWLYEIAWEPVATAEAVAGSLTRSSPPTETVATLDRIMASMVPILKETAANLDCSFLPQYRRDSDAVCVQFILQALEQNGLELNPGKPVADDLCATLHISRRHERLLGRILGILEEEGVIRKTLPDRESDRASDSTSEWVVQRVPARFDTAREMQRMRAAYPLAEANLNIFERASLLGQVLQGRVSGLELLFPQGSMALAEALYQQTVHARVMNPVIARLTQRVIESLPFDPSSSARKLRILELGAGTGSTTGCILPLLPAGRVEYFFTDVSKRFLTAASSRFSQHSFMRYTLHDIESSDVLEGESPASFDLVIAANVLHATKSLRVTLANVRNLLAPGGFLLLLEASHSERMADITLGTLEGWWRFEDTDLRQRNALISPASWQTLLAESGFRSAVLPAQPDLFGVTDDEPAILARLNNSPHANLDDPSQPFANAENATGAGRRVLLISPNNDYAVTIAAHLRRLGAVVIHAVRGSHFEMVSGEVFSLAVDDKAQCSALFALPLLEDAEALSVVYLCNPATPEVDPAATAQGIAADAVRLVQEVLSGAGRARSASSRSLWFVTAGMHPASSRDTSLAASVLTGLVRVVASEYPDWSCHTIDGDPEAADGSVAAIAETILAHRTGGQPEFAIRDGRVLVPKLRASAPAVQPPFTREESKSRAWLITGGFGVLGLLVARWLAEFRGGDLVLFGRNPPSRAASASIDEIRVLGVRVVTCVGDVSVEEDVRRLFEQISSATTPLRGIFHTAAVLEDASVLQLSRESLDRVLAPKVAGSWLLHKHSSAIKLEHFVLFSSAASVLGSPGQLNYAMANTFMDALAHYRQAHRLPGVTIDWGPWSTSGFDPKRDYAADWRARGGECMTPAQGLDVLDRIMRSPNAQLAVLPIDWNSSAIASGRHAFPAILKGLLAPGAGNLASSRAPHSSLKEQLNRTPVPDRARLLASYTEMRLVQLLGLDGDASIPQDTAFLNLGLDSLMSLELKNEIQSALQIDLSPSLFYDHATLRELNTYFAGIFHIEAIGDRTNSAEESYDQFRL